MVASSTPGRAGITARAGAGLLAIMTVVAGCSSGNGSAMGPGSSPSATSSRPAPTPSPAPPPAPSPATAPSPTATSIPGIVGMTAPPVATCRRLRCQVARSVPLLNGYMLRVWTVSRGPAPAVLELLRGQQPVAWMPLLRGQGLGTTLTCEAAEAVPNCIVNSPVGVHSVGGEMILVPNGRLVDTGAFAVAATPILHAADLNSDGYLDIAARDSDYKPNFAQGHLFDRTYRYDPVHRRFVATGCSALLKDPVHAPAPTSLLSGRCPVI